jgi:hypothetical protein
MESGHRGERTTARLGFRDRLLDQRRSVLRRLRGSLRQAADLLGNDRETHSGLTGSRGLDCRVEREQVGLKRESSQSS